MRDRLIELCGNVIESCKSSLCVDCEHNNIDYPNCMGVHFADYLLANNGLFPPVNIGQELWDIHYNKPRKWEVVYLGWNGKEWHINIHWWKDRHNFKTLSITYPFIGKMWYFTKEEAEQALKGGVQE